MSNMKTIGVIIIAGLVLPAASGFAAETFDARKLHLKNVTGTVLVRTADVANIKVDIDNGAGVVDPLEVSMDDGTVMVVGRKYRNVNCSRRNGKVRLSVARFGIGKKHPLEDFPTVTVTVPKGADLEVSGGRVFGEAGDLGVADIDVNGCGDFAIGEVIGDLDARVNGSGDFVSGAVGGNADVGVNGSGDLTVGNIGGAADLGVNGSGDLKAGNVGGGAELKVNGSGDVIAGIVQAGLRAKVSGSGDVRIASVDGAVTARVSGSGEIRIDGGTATPFHAGVSGSGDVAFQGHANGVHARVSGSGDITLASYDGEFDVSKKGVHVRHK